MSEWVLILWMHAAFTSDKDNMAVASVGHFASREECKVAGEAAKGLTNYANTWKISQTADYVCVSRSGRQRP